MFEHEVPKKCSPISLGEVNVTCQAFLKMCDPMKTSWGLKTCVCVCVCMFFFQFCDVAKVVVIPNYCSNLAVSAHVC
jgi:hypothetical protein